MEKINKISAKVTDLESQLNTQIEGIAKIYIEKANYYLRKFNPNLEIKEANKQGQQLVYYINIDGIEARSDASNIPLKHTLSEGDKSSLSLSFFLARLDLLPNINNRIIVFDDPISSFDTRRRMMTISILSKIAQEVSQFFLLSHDINFIKEFCDRNPDSTNLKIVLKDGSSVFVFHDIDVETMTGITKDIYTLQKYLKNGAITDFEKREVIRCMRPVIEGIFRFKYLNEFTDKEWLGNFLEHIRKSDKKSPLYRLNNYYDELSDINDYCKQYHHSNPKYMEVPIFDEELRHFVKRTLDVLAFI
jgi:wobble nucleotide-excising tRNase